MEWEFKKEKEGIRVYTRTPKGESLKELKMTLTVEASLTTVAAVLSDIPKSTDWIYKCSHSETLKRISDKETIDYF